MPKLPLILNIETATEICSVCLSRGEEILAFQQAGKPNDHAKIITVLIEKCCLEAGLSLREIDAVAISSGPGSYTSLRVGVSSAKGICYALNKPLIAVETLQALALATFQQEKKTAFYCPMIDARRMEVYCALFAFNQNIVELPTPKIVEADAWQSYFAAGETIIFSGNGAGKCKEILNSPLAIFSAVECSALHLAPISLAAFQNNQFADLAAFAPRYLKSPNITVSKNKVWTNA